jgi:hypothetical protein
MSANAVRARTSQGTLRASNCSMRESELCPGSVTESTSIVRARVDAEVFPHVLAGQAMPVLAAFEMRDGHQQLVDAETVLECVVELR